MRPDATQSNKQRAGEGAPHVGSMAIPRGWLLPEDISDRVERLLKMRCMFRYTKESLFEHRRKDFDPARLQGFVKDAGLSSVVEPFAGNVQGSSTS